MRKIKEMKNKAMRKASTIVELIFVILSIGALVGWVMNIMAVIQLAMANSELTTMFILRIAGIFVAPLGIILGYM